MALGTTDAAQMASAAAVALLALLLLLRYVLLARMDEARLRMFDAPIVLLFGVFLTYIIANFLQTLP